MPSSVCAWERVLVCVHERERVCVCECTCVHECVCMSTCELFSCAHVNVCVRVYIRARECMCGVLFAVLQRYFQRCPFGGLFSGGHLHPSPPAAWRHPSHQQCFSSGASATALQSSPGGKRQSLCCPDVRLTGFISSCAQVTSQRAWAPVVPGASVRGGGSGRLGALGPGPCRASLGWRVLP